MSGIPLRLLPDTLHTNQGRVAWVQVTQVESPSYGAISIQIEFAVGEIAATP
jgi:hypothetical protein